LLSLLFPLHSNLLIDLNFKTMKRKAFNLSLILMMISLTVTISCKKETETKNSPANISKVVMENSTCEAAFADAFRQVDKACRQNNVKDVNSCPSVSIVPADLTYPKDMVVDYGTSCTGDDGAMRSGKIVIHLTSLYTDSGSVTTITFDNYYVNGRKITGTEIIINKGTNIAGHQVFDVNIQNGNLFSIDGTTSYNSLQHREWVAGDNTLFDPLDDIYMITGTANGITTDGTSYTLDITSPLQATISCAWIESGIILISPQGSPAITVDYGSGSCDNDAVATCSGYVTNIEMP
jgi:hypothetical protein